MQSANENAEENPTQGTCARLAGGLFLGAILVALGGGSILSHIAGNGTFAETAARITASERLYRLALSSMVIVTLSSALLAFALYVVLKPVNSLLAQLAMIFSLGDSFVALMVRMCGFVRLHLYIAAQNMGAGLSNAEHWRTLFAVLRARRRTSGVSLSVSARVFSIICFSKRGISRESSRRSV